MRKPRKEFSKTILRAVAAATVVIVVFSFALMWRTGDTSPLAYIIPGIFTELSAATGFYFWKAKAENEIKLDTIRRQKELEQSKFIELLYNVKLREGYSNANVEEEIEDIFDFLGNYNKDDIKKEIEKIINNNSKQV